MKKPFAIALILALALVSCSRKPDYPEASIDGGEIKLSVDSLPEGEPVFHSFEHEGTKIDYLVLKIRGRVESYFDACAKCSPRKLGYRVQGDRLVCVACGQRYPIDDLRGVGSCYPIPLRGSLEGESYVIRTADVIEGRKYF